MAKSQHNYRRDYINHNNNIITTKTTLNSIATSDEKNTNLAKANSIEIDVLPSTWRHIKVDLFNNASIEELELDRNKHKLAVSIITQAQSINQYYCSINNVRFRDFKRGVDVQGKHYNAVKNLYDEYASFGVDNLRASKCYLPSKHGQKHQTAHNLSFIMYSTAQGYTATLVYTSDKHATDYYIEFKLTQQGLTQQQKRFGITHTAQRTSTASSMTYNACSDLD